VSNFVVLEITQIKEMNYKNQHPRDQFMPSIFKKLGCLHKQVDGF
jgi:hypothetical protein